LENAISEAGWEQGSLLGDVGDAFLFSPNTPITVEAQAAADSLSDHNMEIEMAVRDATEGQLCILITHTCDILKPPAKYPRVEVLRCFVEQDKGKAIEADTNSARYFLVDPDKNLVADIATRTSVEKAVLLTRQPMDWPSSETRFKRFRNWLGSRYTRPVDPEEVVEVLNKPITTRVRQIRKKNINDLSDVLDLVKRIHVFRKNDSEPYDVTLLFFLEEEDWEQGSGEVECLFEDLREQVSTEQVILSYEVTTEARISLSDYLATTYFDLDSYSYEGEDEVGAEPTQDV
jgi:hypothetical protein